MNLKLPTIVIAGILLLVITTRGHAIDSHGEQLGKKLKFNSLECFRVIRTQFKDQPAAAETLKRDLNEKIFQPGVSGELTNLIANVTKALKSNPENCAIVSVTVDSSTNQVAEHKVRLLRFEGVGDAAVQSLAPQLISHSQFGIITNRPTEGFLYDTNLSHLICFGLHAGELKAVPVSLTSARESMLAAIQKLPQADLAPNRPAAPTGLRIQVSQ